MSYIAPDASQDIPTEAREVYDVSGAGDTVVATFSSCAGSRYPYLQMPFYLANKAAGIVVGKIGTSPILFKELQDELQIGKPASKLIPIFPTCRYYKTTACAGAQNHISQTAASTFCTKDTCAIWKRPKDWGTYLS